MLSTKISQVILFLFVVLLIGCSIIPDESFEELPELKIKNIIVTRDDGKVLKGTVVYEGPSTNPTKITVQWDAGFKLFQIPITDSVSVIAKTVYHIQNKRISKIINLSDKEVVMRTEDFGYDGNGYLAKHTQEEVQSNVSYKYENIFYYETFQNQIKFESVDQKRCTSSGCINGFFDGYSSIIPYNKNSPSDNAKTRSSFSFQRYSSSPANNQITYRSPQTGQTSSLNFEEFYEDFIPGWDLQEFNFWGYKNNQPYPSIDLNFRKVEYLLNLYYYVGNYILPQKERVYIEDINGDGAPFGQEYNYSVGAFGKTGEVLPVFWILSRLSLPIDQYNFIKGSSQEFES